MTRRIFERRRKKKETLFKAAHPNEMESSLIGSTESLTRVHRWAETEDRFVPFRLIHRNSRLFRVGSRGERGERDMRDNPGIGYNQASLCATVCRFEWNCSLQRITRFLVRALAVHPWRKIEERGTKFRSKKRKKKKTSGIKRKENLSKTWDFRE